MEYLEIMAITIINAVSFGILIKLYLMSTTGVCRNKKTLEGKTVIVTGANSGIGLETARDLANRKARIILACRDLDKGRKAMEDIKTTSQNQNVVVRHLNLAALSSVRKFAQEILDNEERLGILINNAGVIPPPGRHLTEDNLELQFATNHFGPFLLTLMLLPLLKKCTPSRIINVSSVAHIIANLDMNNLNCEKYERKPFWIYCSTKLANILFTRELSKKVAGTGVTVNALHPGNVKTSFAKNSYGISKYLVLPIAYPFLKTCKSGAQTSIYLAVSEDVELISGQYFVDCKPGWISRKAKNDQLAAELWRRSEIVTGLSH